MKPVDVAKAVSLCFNHPAGYMAMYLTEDKFGKRVSLPGELL
jgi:hypothetical protein